MKQRAIATMAAAGLVVGAAATAALAIADVPDHDTDEHALAVLPLVADGTAGSELATSEAAAASADRDAAGDMSMIAPDGRYWVPPIVNYYPDLDLSGLGGTGPVWRFPANPTVEPRSIARLAEALGLEGSAQPAEGGGWQLIDGDRSLYIGNDAMASWWYNAPSPNQVVCMADDAVAAREGGATPAPDAPVSDGADSEEVISSGGSDGNVAGFAVSDPAVDPTVDPGVPTPACPEPTPPTNLPAPGDAESRARELFEAVGNADLTVTTNAYEWSVEVNGAPSYGGVPADGGFYVSFGQDGMITYAGGYLATPEQVDEYPLLSGEAAIQRLKDGMAYGPLSLARSAVQPALVDPAVDVAAAEPEVGIVCVTTPCEQPGDAPADDIVCTEAPCDDPARPAEPEVIDVHLTSVTPVLMSQWSEDGSIWLVPGYRFTAADGSWYPVLAIPDEYLPAQPQPVPMPEPLDCTDPAVSCEPASEPPVTVDPIETGGAPAVGAVPSVTTLPPTTAGGPTANGVPVVPTTSTAVGVDGQPLVPTTAG